MVGTVRTCVVCASASTILVLVDVARLMYTDTHEGDDVAITKQSLKTGGAVTVAESARQCPGEESARIYSTYSDRLLSVK